MALALKNEILLKIQIKGTDYGALLLAPILKTQIPRFSTNRGALRATRSELIFAPNLNYQILRISTNRGPCSATALE